MNVTTPSGIRIEYVEYPRGYRVNGEKVPSVTTVLRILDKPALLWWSWKQGVEGMVDLIDAWGWRVDGLPDTLDKTKAVEWMKRQKLTINDRRNKAGDRGKGAHDALERFVKDGEMPDERGFPHEDRGFVKALKGWLEEARPELVMAEVMVGSVENQYAGRFDLLAKIDGELWLLDLKTSEKPRVYDEALMQLAAYAGCMEECGYPVPQRKAIVCVGANGEFVVKESLAGHEHFLCVLAAFRAVDDVKLIHSVKAAA